MPAEPTTSVPPRKSTPAEPPKRPVELAARPDENVRGELEEDRIFEASADRVFAKYGELFEKLAQ